MEKLTREQAIAKVGQAYVEAVEKAKPDSVREHRDFIIQHYDIEEVRDMLGVDGEVNRGAELLY